MDINAYRQAIVEALQGEISEMKTENVLLPIERLDWAGYSAVLELYDKALGLDRDNFIQAMKEIIGDGSLPIDTVAQAIHIATSLDIAQIAQSVIELQKTDRPAQA